jgi:hypothetical protein
VAHRIHAAISSYSYSDLAIVLGKMWMTNPAKKKIICLIIFQSGLPTNSVKNMANGKKIMAKYGKSSTKIWHFLWHQFLSIKLHKYLFIS